MALVMRQAGFLSSRVKFFVSHCNLIDTVTCESLRSLSTSNASFGHKRGRYVKTFLGLMTGALATCGTFIGLFDSSLVATGLEAKPPSYPWSMNGALSSLDHGSIRRGWHVYRNVCSTCHSINFLRFQDLVGVSHTENEMKAIAAEYEFDDGPDEDGNYYKRPGKLQDQLPSPFPNEEAARFANNGANPIDLSFIINARRSGKDYVFSLLTGYKEPPAGVELAEGQLFNVYFPGGAISMPEMIQDGIVDYDDGTPATSSQIAKDVVEFLNWTANKDWDMRKVVFMKGIGVCTLLLFVVAHMNRTKWTAVKNQKIFYVPKRKC